MAFPPAPFDGPYLKLLPFVSQIYYLYKIWLSESSGRITWLVDGQMQ